MARPRQISDEEILAEACACFLEHGPGVSTQVIADRLGVSQPALFKRFNTKEELLISALLPPMNLPATEWLKHPPTKGPFPAQLEDLIRVLWASLKIVFPRISMLAMSGIPHAQVHARLKKLPLLVLMEGVAEWLSVAQKQGQIRQEGDPIIWAQTCMGALQGRAALRFILQAHFENHFDARYQNFADDDAFIRSVADVLCRGMSKS